MEIEPQYGETFFRCDGCGKKLIAFIGEVPEGLCVECYEKEQAKAHIKRSQPVRDYIAQYKLWWGLNWEQAGLISFDHYRVQRRKNKRNITHWAKLEENIP